MISIGSCFFSMMSLMIGQAGVSDRIASNIVTGIGFLGAGVIFRGENRINGITTAATIWTVAAVGMGIGAGYFFISGIASLLVLFVLAVLPYLEELIDHLNQSKIYTIQCAYSEDVIHELETIFNEAHLKYKLTNHVRNYNELSTSWTAHGPAKKHQKFIDIALHLDIIQRFEY
jgi:putative Mg2+ transporter-C (MgtC) family protein